MRLVLIAALLAIVFLSSCVTRVPIQATRPAETVDLAKSGVKRIAIGEILGGNGAQDLGESLRESLLKLGKFELLERSQITALVQEHQFDQSGLVDESTTTQAGKFKGATALVTGRAATYGCTPLKRSSASVKMQDGSFQQQVTFEMQAVADVSFQILDVQTSRIVATKKCYATQSYKQSAINSEPAEPNITTMIAHCREDVVNQFIRSIAPYTVMAEVSFEEDSDIPQIQMGINAAKIGDWDDAIKLFQEAVVAKPISDKAHYDLGIAYQMTGKLDDAERELKAAYKINASDAYGRAIKECQAERERMKQR